MTISKQCREERTPVIITVNGRGDTAVLGLQDYYQMKAELELLRTLAEAEEDVIQGYKVLIAERHLVFYKLDDKKGIVIICAIVDSSREYKNLI